MTPHCSINTTHVLNISVLSSWPHTRCVICVCLSWWHTTSPFPKKYFEIWKIHKHKKKKKKIKNSNKSPNVFSQHGSKLHDTDTNTIRPDAVLQYLHLRKWQSSNQQPATSNTLIPSHLWVETHLFIERGNSLRRKSSAHFLSSRLCRQRRRLNTSVFPLTLFLCVLSFT